MLRCVTFTANLEPGDRFTPPHILEKSRELPSGRRTEKQNFGSNEGTRREMAVQRKRFCLFNCDNTYDLKIVEEFLLEVDEKYQVNFSCDSLYFGLGRMSEMVETVLPILKMDFGIFVVHANESRLSINGDNAGIGYTRIYRALLRATGEFKMYISSKFPLRNINLNFVHRIKLRLEH